MPSTDLSTRVRQSARRCLPPDARIAVALSGGVDSVALLHLLGAMRGDIAFELQAIHVNHGLSPNAGAWERFCSDFCAALGVRLSVIRLAIARIPGESLEAQARDARYAAFAGAGSGVDTIALAHHADDQAETVLLQLLRGAAAKGLAAMPEWRRAANGCGYWRPLLRSTRREIVEYARARDLHWIEDESNADSRFRRNFVRAQILPVLEKEFPGYRTSLARAAAHAADEAELLDRLADLDAAAAVAGGRVSLAAVRGLGPLRTGNLLRRILAVRGLPVPPGERLAEFVRQTIEAAKDRHPILNLPGGHVLRAEDGEITLGRTPPSVRFLATWRGESVIALPHGNLRFVESEGEGIRAALIPASGLVIRSRAGGERLQLAANRPLRTLKNLMQEAGVPAALRKHWPLLVHADRVLAVPGIGISVDWQCPPDEPGWSLEWRPAIAAI